MFRHLWSFFRRLLAHKVFKDIILVVIAYLVLNFLISGIIGNSAYAGSPPAWIKLIWEQISKLTITYLLILTSIALAISLIVVLSLWNRSRNLSKALTTINNIDRLNGSLLRLLTKLVSRQDSKSVQSLRKEMRRLLVELLRDGTQTILGDKSRGRAAILFPSSSDSSNEYLEMVVSHRVPLRSTTQARFYIGKDENKASERGSAGVAFLDKCIHIGHINTMQKNGYWEWECDDEHLIDFDGSLYPPYCSFVNAPIIGPDEGGSTICLGIIYFDSPNPMAFDSHQIQAMLESISRSTAAALAIYIQLVRSYDQSASYFDRPQ